MQRKTTTSVLVALREAIAKQVKIGVNMPALIVTCKDDHLNINLADCDQRVNYISGYTGHYGTAVITKDVAHLWTDRRYNAQANLQMDENWSTRVYGMGKYPTYHEWLVRHLPAGSKVGINPRTYSVLKWKILEDELRLHSIQLLPLEHDLVDTIWTDKPKRQYNPLQIHPIEYTGRTILEKMEDIWRMMKELPASIVFVNSLSEVAWALNLRGSDLPYTPLFWAYLVILDKTFILFTEMSRITEKIKRHIDSEMPLPYSIQPYEKVFDFIKAKSSKLPDFTWVGRYASYYSASMVPENKLYAEFTPLAKKMLIKSHSETVGMKAASVKEGVALCCTLHWLESTLNTRPVKESEVAQVLEKFRSQQDLYVCPGDATTVAFGKNTKIKHYVPSEGIDKQITTKDVFSIRAGAQYRNGSTNVSRVMHFGFPIEEHKSCYTKVLKGIIGLTTAIFPNKSKGSAIDVFARKFIWESGVDYDYRTGHGVGSFLKLYDNYLEIAKFTGKVQNALEAGMFVTVEPVFPMKNYALCAMNIVLTKYADKDSDKFLGFETISLCPIQKKMVDMELITSRERLWLNEYHQVCRDLLLPVLMKSDYKDAAEWLFQNTQPINAQEAIYAF